MDDIWSLIGMLFAVSIPLLIVMVAIVLSLVSDSGGPEIIVPPMPAHPGVPVNAARFFAGPGGIEDTMPDNRKAHGPR
ncbi:hypothetical protein ACFQ7M_22970 [Streptomyces massasporeus]